MDRLSPGGLNFGGLNPGGLNSGGLNPWGSLEGVRPTKIAGILRERGITDENAIIQYFKDVYGTSEEKARLCVETYGVEREILENNKEPSLYIGIPFCPSRCLYCSFTSYPIEKFNAGDYLTALSKEASYLNISPQNIYVGGGTPTSLCDDDLKRLLFIIEKFSAPTQASSAREFSVEAGRPDTITRSKLEILKSNGVTRISVNPQTLNDKTLKIIGRKHTVRDFFEAFYLAREIGFEIINVDLILGLPGESIKDSEHTFSEIERLRPENLTVHTLAIKRASKLKEVLEEFPEEIRADKNGENIERMLKISRESAKRMGIRPYYMYRQKNARNLTIPRQNFENVGYSIPGAECAFNVVSIEEKQTIYAIGAGAVSKIVYPEENRHERIFNVKNVEEYVERIDEMIERKKRLLSI
jgi:oxygen-independent coproporphyrinogen-3 oxidase